MTTETRTDIDALAALLHETAERHDPYEKSSPPHDWWDWYAAYMTARTSGDAPDVAAERAAQHMAAGYGRSGAGTD
jgi:hypothetical protein